MSTFTQFMKQNKKVKENTIFAATKSITDANGSPLLWTLRPISSRQNSELRDECMTEVPLEGKPGAFRQKMNTGKYIAKLLTASCVVPDLYNAELQDSYGVSTPEDLLFAMIDEPGEYDAFVAFVQKFNGFTSLEEKVEAAKN